MEYSKTGNHPVPGCKTIWYAGRDSNPQPSEPESDALSIEPLAHTYVQKVLYHNKRKMQGRILPKRKKL